MFHLDLERWLPRARLRPAAAEPTAAKGCSGGGAKETTGGWGSGAKRRGGGGGAKKATACGLGGAKG